MINTTGLTELNAVVAVARHRSFRLAAAALAISPSALSRAISLLEQRMGVRLFNRTTRSVSLTEAGERLVTRLEPALREISGALEAVNETRDTPAGTLRINSSAEAAVQILRPILIDYVSRYPDMKVDVVAEGRLVDIVGEGFDAGFRLAQTVPLDMVSVPCGLQQRCVVVAAPSYLDGRPIPQSPGDLLAHECIRHRYPSGAIHKWEFNKLGQNVTMDVKGALTLGSHQLRTEAALAGVGLAYLWRWFVEAPIAEGKLIPVLEDWTSTEHELCLYFPAHRHMSAGLRAFVDLVHEQRGSPGH